MGNVRLYGSTSGYTELAPPAVAPDGVLSLPSGTGTIATQSYVDTSSAAAGGLVHINTTTFSAVSSVSLNDVFTSDYDYYSMLYEFTPSTVTTHSMRFRTSGTDNTASSYALVKQRNYPTVTTAAASSETSIDFTYGPWGTDPYVGIIDFFNPKKSSNTGWIHHSVTVPPAGVQMWMSGQFKATTVFDGFSLICAAGNFTGIIRVYGYKNS